MDDYHTLGLKRNSMTHYKKLRVLAKVRRIYRNSILYTLTFLAFVISIIAYPIIYILEKRPSKFWQ